MRRELQYEVRSQDQIPGALGWVRDFILRGLPGGPVLVSLGRQRRTLDQNAKLWPMLQDIADQVPWMVDGQPTHLTREEWKDLFTAALKGQRMVPGVDGGIVVLGAHTSHMDKRTFSDLIELIYAFGSEHGVTWSEPAQRSIQRWRRVA